MRISDWSSDVCSSDLKRGQADRFRPDLSTGYPQAGPLALASWAAFLYAAPTTTVVSGAGDTYGLPYGIELDFPHTLRVEREAVTAKGETRRCDRKSTR